MEIITSQEPVAYGDALAFMEERVGLIHTGTAPECLWFLEHPSLYTAGSSARAQDVIDARFPIHETGRGGQYTYHGPGQRIVYVMVDLKARYSPIDLRRYVCDLEGWVINTLARVNIMGERRGGRVGIWVRGDDGHDSKIAAIGIRVRRGIAYHGMAINVDPALDHFNGIVPCGIRDAGVTSLADQGSCLSMQDLDVLLLDACPFRGQAALVAAKGA